jgi:1-acyl-sn-glycerol-3-phosphate acyltransferase
MAKEPTHFDLDTHIEEVLATDRPVGPAFSLTVALLRKWFKPRVYNLDRLPSGPALFVGNHALFAFDGFLFFSVMNYDHGRFLRGLGDRALFENDLYRQTVLDLGAAVGHPTVCEALMAARQDLLLFPGGTQEAVKHPRDRYTLQWGERYGFIRLAAKMGYTIVPFACVGPDEYFDQHISGEALVNSQLMRLLTRQGLIPEDLRDDLVPPLPAGVLGTLIPKPKSTFFGIGQPLSLAAFTGQTLSEEQQHALRHDVEARIEDEIKALLLVRERQRYRDGLLRRILSV